jgi:hypothetical protein
MQMTRSWRLLPFIAPLFVSTFAHAQSVEPSVTGKGLVGGALLGGEVVMLTEAALKVKPAWAYYVGGGAGLIGGGIAGHYLESSLSSKSAMYLLSVGMLLVIPTAVASLNATSYDTPLEYTQDAAPFDGGVDQTLNTGVSNPANELPTMPAANATPAAAEPPSAAPAASPPPPATTTPATPSAPAPSTAPAPTKAPVQPQGARQLHRNRAIAHWRSAPVVVPPALLDLSGKQLALAVPAVEIRDTYTRREVAMYGVKQQTEVRVPLFQMAF